MRRKPFLLSLVRIAARLVFYLDTRYANVP